MENTCIEDEKKAVLGNENSFPDTESLQYSEYFIVPYFHKI
jgi:hypothetical protein